MPRHRFSKALLEGMAPGLATGARSLASGRQAFEDGSNRELEVQSKLAQALSQVRQNDAQADHYGAQAERQRTETGLLERRPQLFEEQVAAGSGTDVPIVRAIRQSLATGQAPQIEMAGPTQDGGALMGNIEPEKVSKVAQVLQRLAPVILNAGDFKIDDWAKANDLYRDQDLSQGVIDGRLNRNTVAGAQAAAAGKAQYHANESGAVLDLFGGALDTSNPMAQGEIGLRKERASQARATAVNQYAIAGKTREETRQLVNGGGTGRPPTGYAWGASGEDGRPALVAIKGGPADGNTPKPPPGEVRRMNIALRALATGLDEYERLIGGLDPRNPRSQLDPQLRAKAQALMGDLQLQYKEAQALGALTGPDLEVLGRVLTDPMTLRGAMYGQGGLKQQLSEARGGLRRRSQALADEFGTEPIQINGAGGGPPVGVVEGGYRFKGGDPADQNNWEKVR